MTTTGSAGALRRLAAVLAALPVLLAVLLTVGALPASAHASLVSTTPAQGSELATAPTQVTLTFDEEVGLGARAVEVTDPRGRRVDDAIPVHPGGQARSVRVGLHPGLPDASYSVSWRVVSADGHPISGTFAFGVGVPAGAVADTTPGDPVVEGLHTVAQFLSYAGAASLLGSSAFLFLLWPAGQGSGRMRRLLTVGVVVAAVGAVGALLVQGPYAAGRGVGGLVDPGLLGETFGSSYGRPLLLRVLAVALFVPVLGIWPRVPEGEEAGPGGIAAAGNALLLAASFSLTGHASEASPRLLAETADAVHLGAAGVWLGGLAILLVAYLPDQAARPADVDAVLPRWSRIAAVAVGLVLITGVYQGWRETGAVDATTGTTYGRLLIGKVAIVVVLVAVANTSRLLVARAGAGRAGGGGAAGLGRLRVRVGIEALLGVGVLVMTSFLVATPPARTSYGPPFSTAVAGQSVDGTMVRVALDISPTRVGAQTVRVHAYTPTGEPLPFASATGSMRLVGSDSGPVRMTFTPIADGAAVASGVVVPARGSWTLTVQLVTDATTDYAATATYMVR